MIDRLDTAGPDNKTEKAEPLDILEVWASWLEQAKTISADVFELALLELRLAIDDSKRLFLLGLLFLPLLMLTWISMSALIAWQIYLFNMSVTQGLLAFCIIQLLALVGIIISCNYYKRSLSLPLTRQNIRQFIGKKNSDT
ncbi:hypothetical protein LCGC14_1517910 [marine sediment metagenome]|uniref:Phage holin family protein n=1 Tax=marine sediment metagenome TaxID=412755 RepID=A0A0F9LF70_9ZZZZ|nr:hypothetical protein [Methylophaga sp.]